MNLSAAIDKLTDDEKRKTNAFANGVEEKITLAFRACDADKNGKLDLHETHHALQAFGLYPSKEETIRTMRDLGLNEPLELPEFNKLLEAMCTSGCARGLHAVPYARRGLTLGQIRDVLSAMREERWLLNACDRFNENSDKKAIQKRMNLYAIDEYFVMPTTSRDGHLRDKIPETVLEAAGVPDVPMNDVSYSQMLNPNGVCVDYFVSHWWGNEYEDTERCLSNFAKAVYKDIGKESPDDVVFWVCLFSLNQHQKKEEVGATPEEGPFNAALAHAKHGAVMVLDGRAEPMARIWCLFEISRAKELAKPFQLIAGEGPLAQSELKIVEEISEKLVTVRASDALASSEDDKLKIHYRILDPVRKRSNPSLESFKLELEQYGMDEGYFEEFDVHICGLIATPLMEAGLAKDSAAVCMRAIGMGATVTVEQLEDLTERVGVDLKGNVETRLGTCSLASVFAWSGLSDELKHVLDAGVAVDSEDDYGCTPLHRAAERGHVEICKILLAGGAEVGSKTFGDFTALHYTAQFGRLEVCRLLLDNGGEMSDKNDGGRTPLIFAAMGGYTEVCALLLDRGAEIGDKANEGVTSLIVAAENGHFKCCKLLLDRGAEISDKDNGGFTSLIAAAQNGHFKCCELLLDRGAEIGDQNNEDVTSLILAAQNDHLKCCELLLDRGANVNDQNDDGRNALHHAAYCGHTGICKLLVNGGADVNVESYLEETPLDEAKVGGHGENTELCRLLQNRGVD